MQVNEIRAAVAASVIAAGLTAFAIQREGVPFVATSQAQAARTGSPPAEFDAMLARVDGAQLELQNGSPQAFKSLWSRADDITLAGGFGGSVEKGWDQISRRLDWVGAQFSKGTHAHQRIVSGVSGDLGYVVQTEQIRFHVPGQASATMRDYRVTMLFRREAGGWRIIHRHADSQTAKQAPQ
jgi:ketosteroid isomerase-like protein